MIKSLTLVLDTHQLDALYQQLMRGRFTVHDFDALTYAYDWSGVYPEVLGTVKQLRARVAKNAVRTHLDEKNPASEATGDGNT